MTSPRENIHYRHGDKVCSAKWMIQRYKSCTSSKHPIEKKYFATDSRCPIKEKIPHYYSCRDRSHGREKFETTLETESPNYEDFLKGEYLPTSVFDSKCKNYIDSNYSNYLRDEEKYRVTVSPRIISKWRSCRKRNWTKKCISWNHHTKFTCEIKIQTAIWQKLPRRHCGTKWTETVYQRCEVNRTYQKLRTYHCGKQNVVYSSRNKNISWLPKTNSSLDGGKIRNSEKCSTGDDLPASNMEQTQKKFIFLKEALMGKSPIFSYTPEDQNEMIKILEIMFVDYGDWLDDSQMDWIFELLTSGLEEARKNP